LVTGTALLGLTVHCSSWVRQVAYNIRRIRKYIHCLIDLYVVDMFTLYTYIHYTVIS